MWERENEEKQRVVKRDNNYRKSKEQKHWPERVEDECGKTAGGDG